MKQRLASSRKSPLASDRDKRRWSQMSSRADMTKLAWVEHKLGQDGYARFKLTLIDEERKALIDAGYVVRGDVIMLGAVIDHTVFSAHYREDYTPSEYAGSVWDHK